jgi:hypothetical protein
MPIAAAADKLPARAAIVMDVPSLIPDVTDPAADVTVAAPAEWLSVVALEMADAWIAVDQRSNIKPEPSTKIRW